MDQGAERNRDRVAQGVALVIASVTAMAFADAMVKEISEAVTLWQIFAVRSAFAIPCLIAFAWAAKARLRSKRPGWVLLRSLLVVLTWLSFYGVLPVMPLALVAVCIYTNPIFTALLSAAMLGERVSPRQWAGVCLGFLGVAVALAPGDHGVSWYALAPLGGALCYAAAMVLTRGKCQAEGAVGMALNLHVVFVATGLAAGFGVSLIGAETTTRAAYPFLLADWPPLSASAWGVMAALGVLSAAYFLGVARAYQIAPPQIVGTFDYGYLVAAAIWGAVLFAEIPDATVLIGMAIIILAGLLVAAGPRSQGGQDQTP